MTHFAQWQITDICVANKYFVFIDFRTALGFATIQFNYICVYLFISSETKVRRIHSPFELVFIPVSAPEVSHCSGNRISVSSGKGLNLLTNNVFLLLKYDENTISRIFPRLKKRKCSPVERQGV